jgi:hypothetical protein
MSHSHEARRTASHSRRGVVRSRLEQLQHDLSEDGRPFQPDHMGEEGVPIVVMLDCGLRCSVCSNDHLIWWTEDIHWNKLPRWALAINLCQSCYWVLRKPQKIEDLEMIFHQVVRSLKRMIGGHGPLLLSPRLMRDHLDFVGGTISGRTQTKKPNKSSAPRSGVKS